MVNNDDIANRFVAYYTHLYNLAPSNTQSGKRARIQLINEFLSKHTPTRLSVKEANELAHPISPEEVDIALKQLKPGKSPGPDGLTSGYYKSFQEILRPHFLTAFNSLSPDNPPPEISLQLI